MKNKNAIAKHFSFLASCVTGYDVTVQITDDRKTVGCTTMPNKGSAKILLSCNPRLYDGVSETRKLVLMLGVLAHECLHLCFTNFEAINTVAVVIQRKPDRESLFEIDNIVEDAAIEFVASRKIGGKMLKALHAVIKHTWETSADIHADIPEDAAEQYAYTQVLRAMIQVGDRGSVKGKFLSALARDAFADVLPLMNAAVLEPNGEARVDYAMQIYERLRPLRINQENDMDSEANDVFQMPEGFGEGQDTPCDAPGSALDALKQKMREQLESRLQGDCEPSTPAMETDANADNVASSDVCDNTSDMPSDGNNSCQVELLKPNDECPYAPSKMDENDLSACDEDMDFTDDEIESLVQDIENVAMQIEISEKAESILAQQASLDVFEDSHDVINIKADNPDEERYLSIARRYASQISQLKNEMQKIFMNDRCKTKISNRGSRINTKRLVDGRLHSNILFQRTYPKDIDDMAVYLLIDKSGSMVRPNGTGKTNAQCAAETAICLYEALHALRIPVYVTGFTTRGQKALHMHYVTWNSTSSDKFALANFAPDDCNYDFLSIAEASRVLKKHPAKHKILVVLSDGAPCNRSSDKGRMDAVMATALAVSQAEKIADVLGVAMNCYDPNAYATMYGKDYISVSTANDMFLPISVALRQIVKKW